jgi:hypothetical protein
MLQAAFETFQVAMLEADLLMNLVAAGEGGDWDGKGYPTPPTQQQLSCAFLSLVEV